MFLLSIAQAHTLQTFKTDYCTLFAEGTVREPNLWKHCCYEHDLRYWFGGSFNERDSADAFLKKCVRDVAGNFWARVIYNGVRNGHHSPIQAATHWGWGWDYSRPMTPLTSSEKDLIREELFKLRLDRTYTEQFIIKYKLN